MYHLGDDFIMQIDTSKKEHTYCNLSPVTPSSGKPLSFNVMKQCYRGNKELVLLYRKKRTLPTICR